MPIFQFSKRPLILPGAIRMAQDLEADSAADGSIWPEVLPQHLLESLLVRLPLDCIFRLRCVCKYWNDVLSSKHFGRLWAESGGGQPCLILCMPNSRMRFLVYSFFSRTWQTLSLSFIPDVCRLNFRGSAAGLLLLDIPICPTTFGASFSQVCVCNPLSRTCFVLPKMLSITSVMGKAIVAGDDPGSYKVLVVGKTSDDTVRAEMYNSSTKSWKMIGGTLPAEGLIIRHSEMFVCNGFLFFLTVRHGMMGYHIREGKSFRIDLPDYGPNIWPRLVACESSILIVGGIEEENHLLKEVIIWELFHEDHGFSWKEIGRMPGSVCRRFGSDSCSTWFECVGVGDKICFRSYGNLQVVVYSVTHGKWDWLPDLPAAHQDRKHLHLRSLAFEARPNTKV